MVNDLIGKKVLYEGKIWKVGAGLYSEGQLVSYDLSRLERNWKMGVGTYEVKEMTFIKRIIFYLLKRLSNG